MSGYSISRLGAVQNSKKPSRFWQFRYRALRDQP